MPDQEQIQEEIQKLKVLEPHIRPHSAFGDNNVAAIRASIKVLEENFSRDEIYDRFDIDDYVLESALATRDWLDGHEEVSPYKNFEFLTIGPLT